jgi:hypothetical protein
MEAVQVRQVVLKDGEILITGLPYKKGQAVDVIVFPQSTTPRPAARLTFGDLRRSGLIGMWQDRRDITDSSAYARQLREEAQRREDIDCDPSRYWCADRSTPQVRPRRGVVRRLAG